MFVKVFWTFEDKVIILTLFRIYLVGILPKYYRSDNSTF
jgi:hypothetical protein